MRACCLFFLYLVFDSSQSLSLLPVCLAVCPSVRPSVCLPIFCCSLKERAWQKGEDDDRAKGCLLAWPQMNCEHANVSLSRTREKSKLVASVEARVESRMPKERSATGDANSGKLSFLIALTWLTQRLFTCHRHQHPLTIRAI